MRAIAIAICLMGWTTPVHAVPLSEIQQAHQHVQRTMRYRSDAGDHWNNQASQFGDCEDFALAKRRWLLERGASPQEMRIVLGHDWRGNRHAVLFVREDNGQWWVLDNQSNRIVRAENHSMSYDQGGPWGDPR